MEGLAQAITTLPPDAVDRQRLLECLGNAEKNRRNGKVKEAAKWVMQVGAALHKKGGEALPLAERTFQHSVFLAKQLDNNAPEYMQIEMEGNNSELGDAYTWLGATESALGVGGWGGSAARSTRRSPFRFPAHRQDALFFFPIIRTLFFPSPRTLSSIVSSITTPTTSI